MNSFTDATRPTRVVIVDDHLMLRRGIAQILGENPSIIVSGEAAGGPDLMRLLREHGADVVLLDIALNDRDGFDVLKQLRSEFPQVAVLMLSTYPESQFGVRALKSGASGYLNKGCSTEQLFEAIARVARGGMFVTPELAERLAFGVRSDTPASPLDSLSNREMQVLKLLAGGHSVGDIARDLSLSANTISTYRRHGARHEAFDPAPAEAKIRVARWQGQDAVQMIRQQHPGINVEWTTSAHPRHRVAQSTPHRFIAQNALATVGDQSEEERSPGRIRAAIPRHERAPEKRQSIIAQALARKERPNA
jgi:two-component system invasion response regulator UvrY